MSLILIVSQDASCRERVIHTLGEAGWSVRGFETSEDALRAAAEQAPDLVIASATIPSIQRLLGRFARVHGGPGAIVLVPMEDVGLVTADQYQADEMLPESFSSTELMYLFQRFVTSSRSMDRPQPMEEMAVEDRMQLTSVDIFGDVLAEVEAEAESQGVDAFPNFSAPQNPQLQSTQPQSAAPVSGVPLPGSGGLAPPPESTAPVPPPPKERKKRSDQSIDDLLDKTLSSLDLGSLTRKRPAAPVPPPEPVPPAMPTPEPTVATPSAPPSAGRETIRFDTSLLLTPEDPPPSPQVAPPEPPPVVPEPTPAIPAPVIPPPEPDLPTAPPAGRETMRLDPMELQKALAQHAEAESSALPPVPVEPPAPVEPLLITPEQITPEPPAPITPDLSATVAFSLDEPEEDVSFFPPTSFENPDEAPGLASEVVSDEDSLQRTGTGSIWPTEAKIERIDEPVPQEPASSADAEDDWSFSFADPIKPPPAAPLPSKPFAPEVDPANEETSTNQNHTQPFSVVTPGVSAEGQELGQYTLTKRIAIGGMAEVWMAQRRGVEGFSKTVAIKRILSHLTTSQEFIKMFIDEAKLAAQLNHNHITQIYELGKFADTFFIAMEYVDGKDLRTILNHARSRNQPLPLPLALMIAGSLARALDYAHRKRDDQDQELGLVHRDVSPQNVLIGYEGEIKLCDFGIAKAVVKASTTQMGALKGKLQYMSPEQAWGKAVDGRSDIFSLGSVFFEMLTGTKLFVGDSEISVLDSVRECRITAPRELVPDLPKNVEKILLKALTQSPKKRYQTAGEMESDVKEALLDYRASASQSDLADYMHSLFKEPPPAAKAPVEEEAPVHSAEESEGTRQDRPAEQSSGATQDQFDDFDTDDQPPKPGGWGKKIVLVLFVIAALALAIFFALRMSLPQQLSQPDSEQSAPVESSILAADPSRIGSSAPQELVSRRRDEYPHSSPA